ncbi:MAG: hypothetical protein KJO35_10375, partial [Gammaproteobacteria bacterium]|nr:hypothetical protein [Gammaproteobacteria bacterium]
VALLGLSLSGANADTGAVKPQLSTSEYVSPGKISAGITMTHRLEGDLAVGQPVELELSFSTLHAKLLDLDIRADEALAVPTQRVHGLEAGNPVRMTLVPQTEGRFYVRVLARVGEGKNARARAFSVPVQVGKGGPLKTAKKATRSPDGELLVRMRSK